MNKAIEKLTVELSKEHNRAVPSIPILNYLIAQVEENEELASRITLENKTIKECFEYVLQEVRKLLDGKNGWLDDQEVYDLAINYFISDDIEIKKPKPIERSQRPVQPTVKKIEKKVDKKELQISFF